MNVNPGLYYRQSSGLAGDLFTLGAWVVVIGAIVEIFYIAKYKVDFLAGKLGIITNSADAVDLIIFWLVAGLFALSLATGKGLKLTAGILAIYVIYTLYGVAFHFTGTNLVPTNLPTVAMPGISTNSGNQQPISSDKSAIAAAVTAAKAAGYTQRGPISAEGKKWCNQDDDGDGTRNADDKTAEWDVNAAEWNCTTGVRWKPAGQ